MAQLFISYARADELFARTLAKNLDELGADVWIDVDDIRAGEDWSAAIQRGLDECSTMLLIISSAAMQSRRVTEEWRYFRDRDKLLIPILREKAQISFRLSHLQYIDFEAQSFELAFLQLRSELQRYKVRFSTPLNLDDSVPIPVEQEELPSFKEDYQPLNLIKPPLLQSRVEFNRPEFMIDNVQHDLWMSGISLNRMARQTEQLTDLMKREGHVRFLILDPSNADAVRDTALYVGQKPEVLQKRLEVTLIDLCDISCEWGSQAEIRLMAHRPSVGYFISDPRNGSATMTVAPYFYHIDRVRGPNNEDLFSEPPFIYLEKGIETRWFDVYLADFERQWAAASQT